MKNPKIKKSGNSLKHSTFAADEMTIPRGHYKNFNNI